MHLGLHLGMSQRGGGAAAGPLDAWSYLRTVTVDNTGNTAKSAYPVKIALTSGNFDFAHAETDASDIRVTEGGSIIPHWIESWDSVGQTGVVWALMGAVPANTTATLDLYCGNPAAVDASSIHDTFTFGEDWTDLDRLIGYPDKSYAARSGAVAMVLGNRVSNIVLASGSAGTWNESVREQGNIIYDAADADAAKRYKFYYTGQVLPSASGTRRIGLAYSADGVSWTNYASNPVISEGEDPYIVRNIDGSLYRDGGGLMHLFCEDQANTAILHYTSSDGITWTADPTNPVMTSAGGGAYDATAVASPTVIHCGGDNKFVMVYESRAGSDTTSLARATTLMGDSWTREASNPIHAGDVIDDFIWTGTEWVMIYHGTSALLYRATSSVADPYTWTSTSFTDDGPNPSHTSAGISYMGVPEADGTYGRKLTAQPAATTGFDIFDVMGSDHWQFERLGANTDTTPRSPYRGIINAKGGVLEMFTSGDATAGFGYNLMAMTKQLALVNNFQVMWHKKTAIGTSDDRLTQIGIGAGDPITLTASSQHILYQPNGYYFLQNDPGAGGDIALRRYVASAFTSLATGTTTAAEANNFNRYELSYFSASGTLRYSLNGVSKVTANDTSHIALSKQLVISQARADATLGGNLTVDWVAVRPYDGQDPAQTVGAEGAA